MASQIQQKAIATYHDLLSRSQHLASTTILTTISLASILIFGPSAYRDYKIYMGYGPGGLPHNVFGWLIATVLLRPITTEVFSTDVYTKDIEKDKRSFLAEKELKRKGERPAVGPHAAPQRQLDQIPDQEVQKKLVAAFDEFTQKNLHIVKSSLSKFERYTDALFLADSIPASPIQGLREISHIHGTSDHSVHVTLSPVDSKKVIDAGWGHRHPLDGSKVFKKITGVGLSNQYMYIYAPRDDEEIETVMGIVKASVAYMTGSKEVR